MFNLYWKDICKNSILDYDTAKILYEQILSCAKIEGGVTAEVGVYEGMTSKLIKNVLNKTHYCYDTFQGIVESSLDKGDKHINGEFTCQLEKVKQNINSDNVLYKEGIFPQTFLEHSLLFCFVYSDTGTYLGAKNTFECFKNNMVPNGKIIFYIDDNCSGVKNAIKEFEYNNLFNISTTKNFIIFTKI